MLTKRNIAILKVVTICNHLLGLVAFCDQLMNFFIHLLLATFLSFVLVCHSLIF